MIVAEKCQKSTDSETETDIYPDRKAKGHTYR